MLTSSPFIDNPAAEVLRDDSEYNSQQLILNLRFQLSSIKTEKELLKVQNTSLIDSYELIIASKSNELKKLQENFDYIYTEKAQLELKLKNLSQIDAAAKKDLELVIIGLKRENKQLSSSLQTLKSSSAELKRKLMESESKSSSQRSINTQLSNQLSQFKSSISSLTLQNKELVEKLNAHSKELVNESSIFDSLNDKNASLQRINNSLQAKVDHFLQNKTQNEILKQKIASLTTNLENLSGIQESYCKLEIDHLSLKNNFDKFFKVIDETIVSSDSPEIKVRKFTEKYKKTEYELMVALSKFNEISSESASQLSQINTLNFTIEDLRQNTSSLTELVKSKDEQIKLQSRQIILKTDEINFLRKLNNEFTAKEKETPDLKSFKEYVSNLENLVEKHQKEITHLQNQIGSKNVSPPTPNKRARLSDDNGLYIDHQRENLTLSATIKNLNYEVKNLHERLSLYETISSKKSRLSVLQHKNNPAAKDQKIKLEVLNVLRAENSALLLKSLETDDFVPKAVFERQETDKQELQLQVDLFVKRNNRLSKTFAEKSKDIIITISKYFGFSIEFLPNSINPNSLSSRIKLVSRYMKESNAYVILDIASKSMKVFGDSHFKSICGKLLEEWIDEKGQFPCFLSALTLKLQEIYD